MTMEADIKDDLYCSRCMHHIGYRNWNGYEYTCPNCGGVLDGEEYLQD